LLNQFDSSGNKKNCGFGSQRGRVSAKKEREPSMVSNRINPSMGVIFDEIEIEEVIAPRF
jgi:hypothetical protein